MERKINAAAFKAKVQIIAVREKPKTLWGATKGTFRIVGDVVGPIVEDWDEGREVRNILGRFDDPPAGYSHHPVADRAGAKARKGGKAKLRQSPRRG